MVNVRPQSEAQFNVLLTQDRPLTSTHWTVQLSRLLEPQGVASYVARTGREAITVAGQVRIHAAVIDLGTPLGDLAMPRAGGDAALWLLELFRRLPNRPPVVIVQSQTWTQRQIERLLHEALRLGAFSVLHKPVNLEDLLRVFQRLVDRQYRGAWPGPGTPPPSVPNHD